MNHTPGPWKVESGCLIFGNGFLVADPFVGENEKHPPEHFPEYAANARLICAAPDLLKACQAAVEAMGMHGPCRQHSCSDCKRAWKLLHAAIDKATTATEKSKEIAT